MNKIHRISITTVLEDAKVTPVRLLERINNIAEKQLLEDMKNKQLDKNEKIKYFNDNKKKYTMSKATLYNILENKKASKRKAILLTLALNDIVKENKLYKDLEIEYILEIYDDLQSDINIKLREQLKKLNWSLDNLLFHVTINIYNEYKNNLVNKNNSYEDNEIILTQLKKDNLIITWQMIHNIMYKVNTKISYEHGIMILNTINIARNIKQLSSLNFDDIGVNINKK